ncbi:MAG TPA: hypothetical protein VEC19_20350 [Usitatibacter sp.]|nr:hypothetical protein [Usitatibacter sp.]
MTTAKRWIPALIEPQLIELVKVPPKGDSWLHEVKYDGYRMLAKN